MDPSDEAPASFTCPRCGNAASARYYGPCAACRARLVATQAGRPRAIEPGRFEPGMHVVPDQVATKE